MSLTLTNEECILNNIEFYEVFDRLTADRIANCNLLLANWDADALTGFGRYMNSTFGNEKKFWESYLDLDNDKKGIVPVRYSVGNQYNIGRSNAYKSLSWVNLRRLLRGILLQAGHKLLDFDIRNAHYEISIEDRKRTNIYCNRTEYYVENRNEVLQSIIDFYKLPQAEGREMAKGLMLRILYCGCITGWLQFHNLYQTPEVREEAIALKTELKDIQVKSAKAEECTSDPDRSDEIKAQLEELKPDLMPPFPFYESFARETKSYAAQVAKANPLICQMILEKFETPDSKSIRNFNGKVLSHYLQEYEKRVMGDIVELCLQKKYIRDGRFSLMHDGGILEEANLNGVSPDQVCLEFRQRVLEKRGMNIFFTCKPFASDNVILTDHIDYPLYNYVNYNVFGSPVSFYTNSLGIYFRLLYGDKFIKYDDKIYYFTGVFWVRCSQDNVDNVISAEFPKRIKQDLDKFKKEVELQIKAKDDLEKPETTECNADEVEPDNEPEPENEPEDENEPENEPEDENEPENEPEDENEPEPENEPEAENEPEDEIYIPPPAPVKAESDPGLTEPSVILLDRKLKDKAFAKAMKEYEAANKKAAAEVKSANKKRKRDFEKNQKEREKHQKVQEKEQQKHQKVQQKEKKQERDEWPEVILHKNILHLFKVTDSQLLNSSNRKHVIVDVMRAITVNSKLLELDPSPYLLAFTNCVFDLRLGHQIPPSASQYITMTTGYNYNTHYNYSLMASMKTEIETLLRQIQPTEDMREYLLSIYGSGMVGISPQKMLYFYGTGGNAKTTMSDLFMRAIGNYAFNIPANVFTGSKEQGSNVECIMAHKKRFIRFSEPGVMNYDTIKLYSGEGNTQARGHFEQETRDVKLQGTVACELNNPRPRFTTTKVEVANIRRDDILPFTSSFLDEHLIKRLELDEDANVYVVNKKYVGEEFKLDYRQVLFEMLLPYAKRFIETGLPTPPQASLDMTAAMHSANDVLKSWFDENFQPDPIEYRGLDKRSIIKMKDFFTMFKNSDVFYNLSKPLGQDFGIYKNFREKVNENVFLRCLIKKKFHYVNGNTVDCRLTCDSIVGYSQKSSDDI